MRIEDTSMEILKWMPLKNEGTSSKVSAMLNTKENSDVSDTRTTTPKLNGIPSKENCTNELNTQKMNDVDSQKRLNSENEQDYSFGTEELPPSKRVKTTNQQTIDIPIQNSNELCPQTPTQSRCIVESLPKCLTDPERQSSYGLSMNQMTTLTAPSTISTQEALHDSQDKHSPFNASNQQQQVDSDNLDDVEMIDEDPSTANTLTESQDAVEFCLDAPEDLFSIARSVTDQIVTRVSSV